MNGERNKRKYNLSISSVAFSVFLGGEALRSSKQFKET
jgi:hypothetical protein